MQISGAQGRATIDEPGTTIQLRYAVAEPATFRAGIEPAPEDVAKFLETRRDLVESAYPGRRGEFERPEQVVVRHILFTGPDALGQAERALARLAAGESFADLALELSRDRATRDQAGLLGAFPRGRLLPRLEEAAFALEAGEISAPVQSERGVHLILLESHEPAVSGFEQVSPRLAYELLRDEQADQAAREAAEAMVADLGVKFFNWYTEAESFIAAAYANRLQLSVTAPFSLAERAAPELAGVEGVFEAAHSLSQEIPYVLRVFTDGDAYYVISLLSRAEPEAQSVEDD